MVNSHWLGSFPLSLVNFLPRGFSDHCPATTTLGVYRAKRFKPFQLFNYLLEHPNFMEIISEVWSCQIEGDPWYVLTSKLKRAKSALKRLNTSVGDLHNLVHLTRTNLYDFQQSLTPSSTFEQLLQEKRLIEGNQG